MTAPASRADSLCVLPWIHLEVMPQGTSKICCIAKGEIHEHNVHLHVSRNSLSEIRASPYMRSVRQALAAGKRIGTCSYCWNDEDRGARSPRQLWNERFPESFAQLQRATESGSAVAEPMALEYLQLSLGNKCNLACRMCNSSYSSRIAEDPVHSAWAPPGEVKLKTRGGNGDREGWVDGVPWFEQRPFVYDDVLANSGSLKLLTVTGGEPLLSDAFQELLDEYVRRDQASAIAVRMSSNLFHNEQRMHKAMAALQRFRYCSIGASIDGYGRVYEYIRHPARWDIVARNLGLVKDYARQSRAVNVTLDVVVQAYNCLSLTDLLRHADSLQIDCFLHVIEHPRFLQMDVVPRDLRLRAAELLRSYAAADDAPFQPANRESALRIAGQFESIADEPTTAATRLEFARFTHALDASRRQRLEDAAPELAAALASELSTARAQRQP